MTSHARAESEDRCPQIVINVVVVVVVVGTPPPNTLRVRCSRWLGLVSDRDVQSAPQVQRLRILAIELEGVKPKQVCIVPPTPLTLSLEREGDPPNRLSRLFGLTSSCRRCRHFRQRAPRNRTWIHRNESGAERTNERTTCSANSEWVICEADLPSPTIV